MPLDGSVSAKLWYVITYLWPKGWFIISMTLVFWALWEMATRNGGSHYNSKNGFSPLFNSFVGSGVYGSLQFLTHLVLDKVYGSIVYCKPWAYMLHLVIFLLTGGLLVLVGFWVEWRMPWEGRKRGHR